MSIGKIGEFDVGSGSWSSYVDRLEMYFLANSIKDEVKLPTLIALMGDAAYELLTNLTSPEKPSAKTYSDVVALLRKHLQPTPSALAERYLFRQRRQLGGENIANYVTELKRLARHCKFATNLEENLRDQFICGLKSDVIRQRLFAEDDSISYTNAVKIATSLEAAERDAAAVEVKASTGMGDDRGSSVHAMQQRGSGAAGGGAGVPRSARAGVQPCAQQARAGGVGSVKRQQPARAGRHAQPVLAAAAPAAGAAATDAAQPITTMSRVVSATTSAVDADVWGTCDGCARSTGALRVPRRCTTGTRRRTTWKTRKKTFINYV